MDIILSNEDIEILEDISIVQKSVKVQHEVKALNDHQTIFINAKLKSFPEDGEPLHIFKLDEFIQLLRYFQNEKGSFFKFNKDKPYVVFEKGTLNSKYFLSNASFLPKDKNVKAFDKADFNFKVTEEKISEIKKVQRILSANSAYFKVNSNGIYLGCVNNDSSVENNVEDLISNEITNETEMVFTLSIFSTLPVDTYNISISKNVNLIEVKSITKPVEYIIALQDDEDDL